MLLRKIAINNSLLLRASFTLPKQSIHKKCLVSIICIFSATIMAAPATDSIPIIENQKAIQWEGFYVGVNAGYWWSTNNSIKTTGAPSYVDSDAMGAQNIANALAEVGMNHFSIDSRGFIGGGQVGYNYLFSPKILLGLELDLNGLSNQNNEITATTLVDLADYVEYYDSSISFTKTQHNLGTVRARVGMLLKPTLLFYGTGGLAYGRVSVDATYNTNESLGAPNYDPIFVSNSIQKTKFGWTVGGGFEWLFHAKWSAKIEGTYYDLGTINKNAVLSQISSLSIDPVVWGEASVHATTHFASGAIRVGLNYFCY